MNKHIAKVVGLLGLVLFFASSNLAASPAEGHRLAPGEVPAGLGAGEWRGIQTQIAASPGQGRTAGGRGPRNAVIEAGPLQVTEEAKLTVVGDGSVNDSFGASVALDGDTLLIGRSENGGQGAAYIFMRGGSGWTLQQKLLGSDSTDGDGFGSSVALSGSTAVIGAPTKNFHSFSNQGAAYVFVRKGGVWTEQQKLLELDGAASDFFGAAVAVSGDTALIGVRGDDIGANSAQGSAIVFVRNGKKWTQQQKLIADNGLAGDSFGYSVAISGDTALVGAYRDDVGPKTDRGSAYVFVRGGGSWAQQQQLLASDGSANDNFGGAVALFGDTAVIGADADEVDAKPRQGSAYVFVRSGGSWTQQQKLTASDGATFDRFGFSVAVSVDTVVVGAFAGDGEIGDNRGSAYVYLRTGGHWAEQQKLTASDGVVNDLFGYAVAVSGDTALAGAERADVNGLIDRGSAYVFARSANIWTETQKLFAGDGASGDALGTSVALSGDTALAGAIPADVGAIGDQGSATVFVRSGTTWTAQQRLTASDGAAGDSFGYSAALSGDTAVIGADSDEVGANTQQGSAYIFVRSGGVWTEQQKLFADDGADSDFFGYAVAVSGDTAVVGAYLDDVGANQNQGSAYVFVRSGDIWSLQQKLTASDGLAAALFGQSVAISGDTLVAGASFYNAAYVFTRSGGVWTEQQKLSASDGRFGYSVALSGDTLAVGAYLADIGANRDQGSAYVFTRSGSVWTQQQQLVASDGSRKDVFGRSLALSGDALVVGAKDAKIGGHTGQGAAYVFTRSAGIWTERQKLSASDGAASDAFGTSVAISGETVLAGAPADDNPSGGNAGAAYVYRIASDYGDAPDPGYATLLVHDGARHFIGGPRLGLNIDAENDGQPNSGATGDDIAGIDDEDGLSFGLLRAGSPATVDVSVTGGPALLDAWIDFNNDGDWADAGERIFDHSAVADGPNSLSFQVPLNAAGGQTYARFRLSSGGVASFSDTAVDGEVEDELLAIEPRPPVFCAGLSPTSGCTVNDVPNQLCVGTEGDDRIRGTIGNDVISGLGGNDSISGVEGDDVLCGDAGNDELTGGKGNDRLFGGDGRDHLDGSFGDDQLDGGANKDTCIDPDASGTLRLNCEQ